MYTATEEKKNTGNRKQRKNDQKKCSWKMQFKIILFTLILTTIFRVLFEKIPYVRQDYVDVMSELKMRGKYLIGYYGIVCGVLIGFFWLKKERTWGNLICMALVPVAYIWSMVLFHAEKIFFLCFVVFCLLDVWLEKLYYEDMAEDDILNMEYYYGETYEYDQKELKRYIRKKCVKAFFRQFLPNQVKAVLWVAFCVLVYVTASNPLWFKGTVPQETVSTGQRLGYTEETAKEIVVATNVRDYISTEESYHWEDNKETIVKLYKKIWVTLSFNERLELLQEILNLECAYLGVESCQLIAEDIKQFNLAGYYWDSKNYVSVEKEYLERERSQEAIWVILHEAYHIYQHRAVENYEKVRDSEEINRNLYIYRDCEKWLEEMRHYKSCVSVEDFAELYQYKSQAMETSAEEYAGEWVNSYLEFAKKTYDELYALPDLTQDDLGTEE